MAGIASKAGGRQKEEEECCKFHDPFSPRNGCEIISYTMNSSCSLGKERLSINYVSCGCYSLAIKIVEFVRLAANHTAFLSNGEKCFDLCQIDTALLDIVQIDMAAVSISVRLKAK